MNRRQVVALGCVLVLVVGCGGSDDKSDATESNDAPTTEPVVTEPAVTEPVATEPASNGFTADDLESKWVVIRQTTSDDSFWKAPAGNDPEVEYRIYDFTCVDVSCAELSATVEYGDGYVSPVPLPFTFDGTTLTAHDVTAHDVIQIQCLNAAGTAYDGPAEGVDTIDISLTPLFDNSSLVSFTGTFKLRSVTAASTECLGEDVGYEADVLMFREDRATKVALSDGVFFGEGRSGIGGRGVQGCAQGACKFREDGTRVTFDGGEEQVSFEWSLTEDGKGRYTGQTQYLDGCLDDNTGAYVADEVYVVTHDVLVEQLTVVGWDVPVLLVFNKIQGEQNPNPGIDPSFLQFCAPFDLEDSFGGIPSAMTDLIDFTREALGVEP